MIFVKKEFFHILRDPRTVMLLLLMPVIQIILFGFALTNEVRNVDIAVYNPGDDIESRMIIDKISAGDYFNVKYIIKDQKEISGLIEKGDVKLVIVFGENFGAGILRGGDAKINIIADASDPNLSQSMIYYVTNILLKYRQDLQERFPEMKRVIITPEVKLMYNPQMKSAYNFVPGVMGLILMLICAMMTSISIVREKETGTMEVLLVSPVKPFRIIIAKTVPYFVLSAINIATVLLLSIFLLDVPVSGSLFWICILSLLFVLVSLSLGMMVSTLVNNQVGAMLISGMAFMMPVILLSGMIFPVENMPGILQAIAQIIPAKWFIAGVRKLMIQGVDVTHTLREFAVLAGMLLLFFAITLKKFKYRLE
jgi:ABC-2 type transport system permease protein